jgi:hypothetical protein
MSGAKSREIRLCSGINRGQLRELAGYETAPDRRLLAIGKGIDVPIENALFGFQVAFYGVVGKQAIDQSDSQSSLLQA